jgi:hypothetical protein
MSNHAMDGPRPSGRQIELSYLLGRFFSEHLVRVHRLFEGDLTEAIVLATIAQHNVQRYYEQVARDAAPGLDGLVRQGRHIAHLRPCNALSVSAATGVPRETVRRKVKRLVERGWVTAGPRGALQVTPNLHRRFEEFDRETVALFARAAREIMPLIDAPPGASPAAGVSPAAVPSADTARPAPRAGSATRDRRPRASGATRTRPR